MRRAAISLAVLALIAGTANAQWITFVNQTATRLVVDNPTVGGPNDGVEKDFAWGDLDKDGWTDLVLVRKSIGSTSGAHINVLYMNEGGVLRERTVEYATASDVPGDQGFRTPTNDRHVVVADVNGDGWLDVVTVPTYHGGASPKHLSHPRVYINQGMGPSGWLGLKFESARSPQLPMAPNFCHAAAGDLTGNGLPDLYFTDYSNPLEDRLWFNNGGPFAGWFSDMTATNTHPYMVTNTFGTSTQIADMNGDGRNDIIMTKSLGPYEIDVAHNSPTNPGMFTSANFRVASTGSTYFVAVGDLNQDGKMDAYVVDDGTDFYLINTGNNAQGLANFTRYSAPASSGGFGGSTVIADLDKDGWPVVLVSDVDVDIPSSGGQLRIYRNKKTPITALFDEPFVGIQNNEKNGTFDIAVLDINGDTWPDLVLGRYAGVSVWIQVPPTPACPPDLNGNGVIDQGDLGILLAAFGSCPGSPNYHHQAGTLAGDNCVTQADLGILLAAFGTSCN